ncbi:hypothetical protein LAZ40_11625 [Cereibacter sphaeroides]|uniref:helix-turn-helix domain-containing protein n=1 Tax=Cereibacter sphaeroides TaxID=1063 RepID=UPI001F3510C7|nr:helix-turn-helix domain-containing protein [Cereibacter sphaeroides]MCE6959668.1 hypothetical protein [Cereibacter sphaeroides]MCE6974471.1 hypothetical protein [Cereibacter sphaeroides]
MFAPAIPDPDASRLPPLIPSPAPADALVGSSPPNPDGRVCEKTCCEPLAASPCLDEALDVCLALDAGNPLTRVAAGPASMNGFAIGHLIHHVRRRGILTADTAPRDLLREINNRVRRSGEGELRNRIQVIRALREMRLVPEDVADRGVKPAGTTPCLRSVAQMMEETSQLPFDRIISPSREKNIVKARFEVIWILRHVCGLSLTVIGRHAGGRDHTTVLNAVNKIRLQMQGDAGYREAMAALCEQADLLGVSKNRKILTMQSALRE